MKRSTTFGICAAILTIGLYQNLTPEPPYSFAKKEYQEALCKGEKDCAVLQSKDYLYKFTRNEEGFQSFQEYSINDLTTKLRELPIHNYPVPLEELTKTSTQ